MTTRLHLRYGLAILFVGSLVYLSSLTAQDPGKGDPAKQPGAAKDKDKLFDDAEIDESKVKPNRAGPPPVIDLKKASREAKQPAVRQLFSDLALPYDQINYQMREPPPFRNAGYSRVKPLDKFYSDKVRPHGDLQAEEFQSDETVKKISVPPFQIVAVVPYEQVAQDRVKAFLSKDIADLPAYNRAVAAEQVLSNVILWHESARSRNVRSGSEWEAVLAGLRKQLFGVLLDELKELTSSQDWEAAYALTQRLSENYPDEADAAGPLADLIQKSLKAPLDPTMRQRPRQWLVQLQEKNPNNAGINNIVAGLKDQAQKLWTEAKALESSKNQDDLNRAQELMQRALDVWELPGLRASAGLLRNTYPVLRVGVRAWPKYMSPGMATTDTEPWPKYMSPGMATTDTEHRVVEFLFESLVKFSPDASGMGRYKPGLAEGRADVISLGRQFRLPETSWSNGEEMTIEDVILTVKQLKKGHGNGQSEAVGELYAENQPVSKGGNRRVNVKLSQGYLEPLSLMTFKIVPRPAAMGDDLRRTGAQWPFGYDEVAFAEKPIGSGPFKYVPGNFVENNRKYLSFVVNANYGSRPSKLDRRMPSFREVRLFLYTDGPDEIAKYGHFLDLLLDLPASEAAAIKDLKQANGFRINLPAVSGEPTNRRVYFLAVNHRKEEFKPVELRRALVRAIDREKLLDDCFRGPFKRQIDKVLNGPFPAGSWANNPDVHGPKKAADLYDPDIAGPLFGKLKDDPRYHPPTLSLKYPNDDLVLKAAMEKLAAQIEKTLPGVKITPEPVSPWALRHAVEKTHDYDLAYYHYDFPDDTMSLWPLFGGEENVFGYRDERVTELLRQSLRFCDFEEVKKRDRGLHQLFDAQVPLIPLWQLDPLLAIHDDVKTVPFDRNLLFTDIELWRLEGKQRDWRPSGEAPKLQSKGEPDRTPARPCFALQARRI